MTAYYNEIDPFCAQWLRNLIAAGLIAPGEVDDRSIAAVQPADVRGFTQCHFFAGIAAWSHALRCAGWSDERPIWTGSCPCQGFSVAGAGKGFADERHLWPEFFRLIRECRPAIVAGEQVASPLALSWLDLVHHDMEGAGYAVGAADLCAASVGAPHIRQRLYWVANAGSKRRQQDTGSPLGDEVAHGGTGRNGSAENGDHVLAGDGADGGMANAELDGVGTWRRREEMEGRAIAERSQEQPDRLRSNSGLAGFWSDAIWLPCSDGKARPTKPGIPPLATGVTGRVGKLRAIGNSLCAPVAQAFIEAVMECVT